MNVHSYKIHLKKWLNLNRLLNATLIILMLVLVFSPPAKALLIRGLMKVGLFQPGVSENSDIINFTDVSFQDKSGKIVSASSLKGKVIFINFWATWCPPCIAELPSINELYKTLQNEKNIEFIIVDTDHNFSRSLAFITKHAYSLPIYNAYTTIPQSMLDNVIPATVVISKKGKIVFKHDGTANYMDRKFMVFLNKLLKED